MRKVQELAVSLIQTEVRCIAEKRNGLKSLRREVDGLYMSAPGVMRYCSAFCTNILPIRCGMAHRGCLCQLPSIQTYTLVDRIHTNCISNIALFPKNRGEDLK